MKPSRVMHWFKKSVLNMMPVLFSVFFTLFLLEIGVRIFIPARRPQLIVKADSRVDGKKELPFRKPLFEATLSSAEYETRINTNSEGFRDVEHEVNKPAGVYRILVVGDSFTYGIGVEADETYPKVMERILNERRTDKGLEYEVFNLSAPAIGTLQEIEIIKYGLKYNPDLILLGMLVENRWAQRGNDLCDNFAYWHELRKKESSEGVPTHFASHFNSQWIDYLNALHRLMVQHSDLYYHLMTKKGTNLRRFFVKFRENKNQDELDRAWKITRDALRNAKAIVHDRGLRLAVLYIPFSSDIQSQSNETRDILVEWSQESGINLLDLSEVLRKNHDKDLYYQADGHWRSLAHRLSAEAITDYLIQNNFMNVQYAEERTASLPNR